MKFRSAGSARFGSSPETHVVTGATGAVGSALVLELLRRTDARIVCLARPVDDPRAAQLRVEQVLHRAARAFGVPELAASISLRCRVVSGDLLADGCGVDPRAIGSITEFWHSAASLRFEDEVREEIFAQNVEGTRRALALARAQGAEKFNHISTAYVAGSRTGTIREEVALPDTPVNNAYEASKVAGEQLVAASGLDYRIMRPSIVIGHSKTHALINPSGFYGYIRKLAHLRAILERRGALGFESDLEVEGDPDVHLNLIPVDAVVAAAVQISRSASKARVFHLTNSEPPSLRSAFEQGISVLGLAGPRLTPQIHRNSTYTEALGRQLLFFVSYLRASKQFDRTHTDAVVGPLACRWPLENGGLRRYVRWYLDNECSGWSSAALRAAGPAGTFG